MNNQFLTILTGLPWWGILIIIFVVFQVCHSVWYYFKYVRRSGYTKDTWFDANNYKNRKGEKIVAEELASDKYKDAKVYNDVYFKFLYTSEKRNCKEDVVIALIDHVLISRKGVFVIETKDWNVSVINQKEKKCWANFKFSGTREVSGPNQENEYKVSNMERYLKCDCVHNVAIMTRADRICVVPEYTLLHLKDFYDYYNSLPEVISDEEVARLCKTLEENHISSNETLNQAFVKEEIRKCKELNWDR